MKRFLPILFSLSILLTLAQAEETKKGAKPRICALCSMSIPDEEIKFSVSDTKSLQKVIFDDIGCALLWRDQQCATMQESFDSNAIVHDYYTSETVGISDAVYVIDAGVKTPIGYGIVAFKSRNGAERFLRESRKGKILTYQELLTIKLK